MEEKKINEQPKAEAKPKKARKKAEKKEGVTFRPAVKEEKVKETPKDERETKPVFPEVTKVEEYTPVCNCKHKECFFIRLWKKIKNFFCF